MEVIAPKEFIATEYSRISSVDGSVTLDNVNIGLAAAADSINNAQIPNSKEFYAHIHKSALGWMAGAGKLNLPGSLDVTDTKDAVESIATVFQAVLKGDGRFNSTITSTTNGGVYDRNLLVSFLGAKIADNTLFSPSQCDEIYRLAAAAGRTSKGALVLEKGDSMGIVIVIEGPWGIKITIRW